MGWGGVGAPSSPVPFLLCRGTRAYNAKAQKQQHQKALSLWLFEICSVCLRVGLRILHLFLFLLFILGIS